MTKMGQPSSHATTSSYTALVPRERIVLTNVIDLLSGVAAYQSDIGVDLAAPGDAARRVVTLDAMHSDPFTRMQEQGLTSQLTKLDARFARGDRPA